jgi:hypothetical protein
VRTFKSLGIPEAADVSGKRWSGMDSAINHDDKILLFASVGVPSACGLSGNRCKAIIS